MNSAKPLTDLGTWKTRLGLLPVPLFAEQNISRAHVLLNGTRGNFCLDFGSTQVGSATRNYAWSSNVGHYIAVEGDVIKVQRWDQTNRALEQYSTSSVQQQLEAFHAYLERDMPRREISIISHGITVFRKLRALLGKQATGTSSLKAFLYLLACANDSVERSQLDRTDWDLSDEAQQIAQGIRSSDWEALLDELRLGRAIEQLTPELHLLIRHASGQLFQEAHYEAVYFHSEQLRLEGFLPRPIKLTRQAEGIGLYFTPSALARALVEQSLRVLGDLPPRIVVFDPACGSGEFLREALRQLTLQQFAGEIQIIGRDISDAACEMARFVLASEKRQSTAGVSVDILNVNSLDIDQVWPANVDLLLMNPPFRSWEDMNSVFRELVKTTVGDLAGPRPDLSHAFLLKAAASLKEKGVLGTIVPASFLESVSSKQIRQRLGEQFAPKLIARLGSHIFSNATVDTALYLAKKYGNKEEPPIAFWADHQGSSSSDGLRRLRQLQYFPETNSLPISKEGYSIYRNPEIGHSGETWTPRPYRAWSLAQRLRDLPRVGDLFDLKQGVRTGAKRAFVLRREDVIALPNSEHGFFRPAVVNESILNGTLRDSVYIFFPYVEKQIETERDLKRELPEYFQTYLSPIKNELTKRAGIDPARWWELTRPRKWQVDVYSKLISTAYGDAGSFAWDEEGVFVVVQGIAWIPKASLKEKVLNRKLSLAYLAILNSSLFSELLSSAARQIVGGQFELAEQYVSQIALPNLRQVGNDSLVREIANFGARIHSGKSIDDTKLTELALAIYGIEDS